MHAEKTKVPFVIGKVQCWSCLRAPATCRIRVLPESLPCTKLGLELGCSLRASQLDNDLPQRAILQMLMAGNAMGDTGQKAGATFVGKPQLSYLKHSPEI